MYSRLLSSSIIDALADTPAVYLQGARQVGKTTLVRDLLAEHFPAPYRTLDDATVLAAARLDPQGFLAAQRGPVVLDEVQRVPELALALKESIDRDRRPGRFLLTGSARLMALPRIADSLVGRMEVITLWPLSQQELEGTTQNLVDLAFAGALPESSCGGGRSLRARVVAGGYPEALTRSGVRRARWYESYLTTLLQCEVRDLSNILDLAALPRLLALLAARTGQLLNVSELSRSAGIPLTTVNRYLALLEGVFTVQRLPAWSTNLGKRLVRSPKMHLVDTGLAAHLLGVDEDGPITGGLLESFVTAELTRQRDCSSLRPALYHYRTHGGLEVDLVLEDRRGRLVGVEVKSSSSVRPRDLRGLRQLADIAGDRFVQGLVLYQGEAQVPLGESVTALPLRALWA